jgi:hypothetical protein
MNDPLTEPLARSGEQQFGIICRQRSGMEAGTISPVARVFEIEELGDADQKDACTAALVLAEMIISKCKNKNRVGSHLVGRIKQLVETPYKEKR